VIWLEGFMVLYALLTALVACSLLLSVLLGIPYVPSETAAAEKVFRRLKLPPRTRMADLGSGDGRIVLLAATKFGWDATGVEINPLLNLLAGIRKTFLHASGASFKTANLLAVPLGSYQLIYIYGFPAMMKKLQPKIISECRRGTWIVSRAFRFPELNPVFNLDDFYVYRA
jgi:hypothetical protein